MDLEKAVVCRLIAKGKKFEIIVDPDLALEIKKGSKFNPEVLVIPEIYRDVSRSLRASRNELLECFNTSEIKAIAEHMIKKGKLQLTAEQRRRMIESKKRQIAELIARKCVDPRTKAPHPLERVLQAMEKVGIAIDPLKPAELQLKAVMEKIGSILPLKMEEIQIELSFPAEYYGKIYNYLKQETKIISEHWNDECRLKLIIEPGLKPELEKKVKELTKGKAWLR